MGLADLRHSKVKRQKKSLQPRENPTFSVTVITKNSLFLLQFKQREWTQPESVFICSCWKLSRDDIIAEPIMTEAHYCNQVSRTTCKPIRCNLHKSEEDIYHQLQTIIHSNKLFPGVHVDDSYSYSSTWINITGNVLVHCG